MGEENAAEVSSGASALRLLADVVARPAHFARTLRAEDSSWALGLLLISYALRGMVESRFALGEAPTLAMLSLLWGAPWVLFVPGFVAVVQVLLVRTFGGALSGSLAFGAACFAAAAEELFRVVAMLASALGGIEVASQAARICMAVVVLAGAVVTVRATRHLAQSRGAVTYRVSWVVAVVPVAVVLAIVLMGILSLLWLMAKVLPGP